MGLAHISISNYPMPARRSEWPRRVPRNVSVAVTTSCCGLLLAACGTLSGTLPGATPVPNAAAVPAPPAPAASAPTSLTAPVMPVPDVASAPLPPVLAASVASHAPVQPAVSPEVAARRLFAYQEQVRLMAGPELAAELARQNAALAASGNAPAVAMELALALAQTRNPPDTARALALVDPIARNASPEQQPWQGLARLLAVRLTEQRRLEDQLDRQSAQLRDSQRNVQQLNEKLEALKAIERSLNNRAPTPVPAGSQPRP